MIVDGNDPGSDTDHMTALLFIITGVRGVVTAAHAPQPLHRVPGPAALDQA